MRALASLVGLTLVVPLLYAAPTASDLDAIGREGKNNTQVFKLLRELTSLGPRLTGSPGLTRAEDWAIAKFRSYGLKNVGRDEWGAVPVGFERGPRQSARFTKPYPWKIEFTTPNWMPGTNGKVNARAVRLPDSVAALQADPAMYKGAWIVMPQTASMRGAPIPDTDVQKELDKLGIAGRIYGAGDERLHSHGTWRDKTFEKRPTQVQVIVRKSDFDRITRNIDLGRNPELEIEAENRWIKGPIKQYNVVAEIPGTDLKDEVVIIGGHIDSWNSPGSLGANDNGTGVCTAIEAARILMASGVKPRRTIKFILWGGEEQGLLGSRAYVDKNKDRIEKIVAVLNDDGGTNYQGGYTGIAGQKAIMEAAFAPTVRLFPEMPMTFDVPERLSLSGSSDHAPYAWEGVPAFFTKEVGRANYGYVWHTQFDRPDQSIPEYLTQSATNHAFVSFHLATIDDRLPRFPKRAMPTADIQKILAVGADMVYEDPDLHLQHDHDHEDDFILEIIDRLKRAAPNVSRVGR